MNPPSGSDVLAATAAAPPTVRLAQRIDWGLLVLRVLLAGSLLLLHGWSKALQLFEPGPVRFADPLQLGELPTLVLAVLTEGVAPVLVMAGFATRWAAAAATTTMAVAFFVVHGAALTGEESGELAFLYLIGFLVLTITGGGRLALDARSHRR